MSRGINKVDEFQLYLDGNSIPEVHEKTGIPLSTLRFRFQKAGILRSRADGVRLAEKKGRISRPLKGQTRIFSQEWKDNIRKGKLELGRLTANGTRVNSNGYAEFTRGKFKGELVHRTVMSNWIGRELFSDEIVHHIDRDKLNNDIDNLALLSESGHGRIHRFEDQLAGIERERNQDGTWG
ncbi:HNH endonuclease [Ignatzschineria rhizosphaerae]|uniref:HNH endonuclease n=1 Tax=Ignatzschineria rhizosphaerae TaxID=2923279 RepID=A0ABY3X4D3_9GAMM|nr:HNH endonuclease [Ignatzschineria rhizosphaerae]UNM95902.1 HNH endonuclease [Ignatzschineria rhizosphaerae]